MEWKHPPKQNGVRAAKNLSLDITDLWTMFLICVENPIVHPMAMPRLDALGPLSPHPTDITSKSAPSTPTPTASFFQKVSSLPYSIFTTF